MNDLPVHVYVAMEANDALVRLKLHFFPLAAITPLTFEDHSIFLIPCSHSCVVHASVGLGIKAHSEAYDSVLRASLSDQGFPSIMWRRLATHDTTRHAKIIRTYGNFTIDASQESVCSETQ